MRRDAVTNWLKAETSNPNLRFYFNGLYTQKKNYKWHNAAALRFEDIIPYLRLVEDLGDVDRDARNLLFAKLSRLMDQYSKYWQSKRKL